jgi:hypothetical protein
MLFTYAGSQPEHLQSIFFPLRPLRYSLQDRWVATCVLGSFGRSRSETQRQQVSGGHLPEDAEDAEEKGKPRNSG